MKIFSHNNNVFVSFLFCIHSLWSAAAAAADRRRRGRRFILYISRRPAESSNCFIFIFVFFSYARSLVYYMKRKKMSGSSEIITIGAHYKKKYLYVNAVRMICLFALRCTVFQKLYAICTQPQ